MLHRGAPLIVFAGLLTPSACATSSPAPRAEVEPPAAQRTCDARAPAPHCAANELCVVNSGGAPREPVGVCTAIPAACAGEGAAACTASALETPNPPVRCNPSDVDVVSCACVTCP